MGTLTTILSAAQAEYIAQTAGAGVEIWPAGTADTVTVAIGEAARAVLEALPEDADGHLDSEGRLWIGGSEYQTESIA
jgi:hypothetical protein